MKTILFICCVLGFAFSAHAQQNNTVSRNANQDQLEQQTQRPAQEATERAARQADVNAQNNKSLREADEKLTREVERSTGKESKNPAETNPRTVKPAGIADPVSAPIKSQ